MAEYSPSYFVTDPKVAIANVSRDIMEVFKLTKLHKLIKIHDDTGKAVSSLR